MRDPSPRPEYEELNLQDPARPPGDLTAYLSWLATHRDVLFHGSQRGDISVLRPDRESGDSTAFGNQRAVFATDDPVWAMWFALLTRGTAFRSTRNGAWSIRGSHNRHYFFSVDTDLPDADILTAGYLYVLPRAGFTREPSAGLVRSAQWASPSPVRPLARLVVASDDFPFAGAVARHTPADSMLTTLRTVRANHRLGLGTTRA